MSGNMQSVPNSQVSMTTRVAEKTAAATLTPSEVVVHVNVAAGATITRCQPSEAFVGRIYTVRNTGSAGTITVASPGGSDQAADAAITIQHGYVHGVSDGVFWYNIASLLS